MYFVLFLQVFYEDIINYKLVYEFFMLVVIVFSNVCIVVNIIDGLELFKMFNQEVVNWW